MRRLRYRQICRTGDVMKGKLSFIKKDMSRNIDLSSDQIHTFIPFVLENISQEG